MLPQVLPNIPPVCGASVPGWVLRGNGLPANIDLNFAAGLYYGGTLGSLISTSRASTGYATTSAGALVSFAANVPRITDLGLLVEEARTNLQIQSTFANPPWGLLSNCSVTTNTVLSPDGTVNATTFNDGAVNGAHNLQASGAGGPIAYTSGTVYTFSAFFKSAARFMQIFPTSTAFAGLGGATLNLSTGAVATFGTVVASGAQTFIDSQNNTWYRLWVAITASATASSTTVIASVAAIGSGRNAAYPGAGADTVIWGAQVEAGSFPTSYIPTTTVAVLRAFDSVTGTVAQLLGGNPSIQSIVVQSTYPVALMGNAQFFEGVAVTGVSLGLDATGSHPRAVWRDGANSRADLNNVAVTFALGSLVKSAVAADNAVAAIGAANGTTLTAGATPGLSNWATAVQFGGRSTGANVYNSYIRRVSFFRTALPQAAINSVTA